MPNVKPISATVPDRHPFVQAFPRLSLWIRFTAAVVKLFGATVRWSWPWRRELGAVAVLCGCWYGAGRLLPTWSALALVVVLAGAGLLVAPVRSRVGAWFRCARTRRQLLRGFKETRAANVSGRLPRVVGSRLTPVGERVTLRLRAGQSAELLDARVEELRAAVKAAEVRVTKDPRRSHVVVVDVVRRDPLGRSADVVWQDADTDMLSMWDPVHLGLAETGEPLRLSLRERSIVIGGEPGAGKSSLANVIASHAAKSPDAHLVLIDPNEVQFGPWRDRALAYASDDPAEALEVLELVRAEIRDRLALLRTLPGVVRKVTPEIAREHDLPLWVLIVDELAFHTSVVGTPAQRNAFNTAARDVVARCRAAGVIPVMATQRPTSDVVPTSLRDLFSLRCAFRTTTTTSSDVILGDSWARKGYSATDIDINSRGVGWLLAEGDKPQRFKAAWLSDDTIADLAVTTIRYRPGMPARYDLPATVPAPRRDPEVSA